MEVGCRRPAQWEGAGKPPPVSVPPGAAPSYGRHDVPPADGAMHCLLAGVGQAVGHLLFPRWGGGRSQPGGWQKASANRASLPHGPQLLWAIISRIIISLSINQQHTEGLLRYAFIGVRSVLWVMSAAGGAAGAWGDWQADASALQW